MHVAARVRYVEAGARLSAMSLVRKLMTYGWAKSARPDWPLTHLETTP